MTKFLTDTEILKWNKRLNNNLHIGAINNYRNGAPDIFISLIYEIPYETKAIYEVPLVEYIFSFSVSKNRSDEFFVILNKLLSSSELITKYTLENKQNDNNLFDIKVSGKIIQEILKSEHIVSNRNFIKYDYVFSGIIPEIMGYVSYLEDAINYFQLIWGYDEGEEICLVDYPIGSIVSHIDDKSKDFLVLDYEFYKLNNIYKYHYTITEMLYNEKSTIINYGDIITLSGKNITFSRNDRIDDILNS